MNSLISFASNIDTKYVYIAVAILGVAFIISLVKKAIKLGILVLVIALLLTYGGSMVSKIQEKYNINVEGDTITAVVDGKEYTLDLELVSEIVITDIGKGKVKVAIKAADENKSKVAEVEMYRFMFNAVKKQAEKLEVPIVEK
jgi:hypothetical protein